MNTQLHHHERHSRWTRTSLIVAGLVPWMACDPEIEEALTDLDAVEQRDPDASALDPDGVGDLDTVSEAPDRDAPVDNNSDVDGYAPQLPTQKLSVAQQGWAYVRASGSLGGSDIHTGTISSAKISTGNYLVDITPSPYMNVQVVAYGSNDTICKRVGGAGGTGPKIACFDADGDAVDSAFVIVFQSKTGASWFKGAYVSSSAAGAAAYSWNSTGGTNSVTWVPGTQSYSVSLGGMNFHNASVHVTANGYVGDYCKVQGWGSGAVTVKCFDSDGDAVQSQFALTYNDMTLESARAGGHTWVSGGTPSSSYSASQPTLSCGDPGVFAASSIGLDLSVTLTDDYFPPASWTEFVPMVTSYGSGVETCKIVNWGPTGSGYRARVRCFDGNGTQINAASTAFSLTFTDNNSPGPC